MEPVETRFGGSREILRESIDKSARNLRKPGLATKTPANTVLAGFRFFQSLATHQPGSRSMAQI
jgi:hypothetical protein